MIDSDWYKDVGFRSNPLFESPLKRNDKLQNYNYTRENLLYHVTAGSICLISGNKGTGKTMLLKYLIDEFRGKKKIIYLDLARLSKRLDIDKAMKERMGFWERLKGKKVQDIILLVDNAGDLTKRSFEKLHYYFDKRYLHAIVFTTLDDKKLKMPKSLKDRIGTRIFHTQDLDRMEAVEVVKEKLDGEDLLKDYQLEVLYVLADKNMHRFLLYVDAVLDFLNANPEETLNSKKINEIVKEIDTGEDTARKEHDYCSECGGRIFNIKGHFRCTECDSFCYGCGALVDDEDEACPNCGKQFVLGE